VIRRIAGTLVREVKRELCERALGEFTFRVSEFGSYRFTCGNRTEYFRTVEFGGEAVALGAFLFSLRPDDVVWDVGASVGLFSVHAAGIAKTVVAFEPDPQTFARLRQNVELNALQRLIQCRSEALGDKQGQVSLRTDGLAGNAPSLVDLGRHSGESPIPMTTVDRLVADDVPLPTVLKIDVEGAELLVLRGATALLASTSSPRLIFLEVHPQFLPQFGGSAAEVEAVISGHGYKLASRLRGDQVHLIATRY
jgi:FkbM family methyltransferase